MKTLLCVTIFCVWVAAISASRRCPVFCNDLFEFRCRPVTLRRCNGGLNATNVTCHTVTSTRCEVVYPKVKCTPIASLGCKGGLVRDVCGCCLRCAKVQGELCSRNRWGRHGVCDKGLFCNMIGWKGLNFNGNGICTKASCDFKRCYGGAYCKMVNNKPRCFCGQNVECPPAFYPEDIVCGSDGKVYDNDCLMDRAACKQDRNITAVPMRMCQRTT